MSLLHKDHVLVAGGSVIVAGTIDALLPRMPGASSKTPGRWGRVSEDIGDA